MSTATMRLRFQSAVFFLVFAAGAAPPARAAQPLVVLCTEETRAVVEQGALQAALRRPVQLVVSSTPSRAELVAHRYDIAVLPVRGMRPLLKMDAVHPSTVRTVAVANHRDGIAVALSRGVQDAPAATAFLAWLKSPAADPVWVRNAFEPVFAGSGTRVSAAVD